MKKLLHFLITLSFLTSFATVYAKEADLTVHFNDKKCTVTPDKAKLFDQMNMAPTQTITRTLEVKNQGTESANLALKMVNFQESGLIDWLSTVLHLKVVEQGTGIVIKDNKTIADWKDKSLVLPAVPGHSSKTYEFQVTLDDVGNNYQDKKLSFDIEMQCNQGLNQGDVLGDQSTRSPGVVIGQMVARLPETGQTILALCAGFGCIGLGLFLKRKTLRKIS